MKNFKILKLKKLSNMDHLPAFFLFSFQWIPKKCLSFASNKFLSQAEISKVQSWYFFMHYFLFSVNALMEHLDIACSFCDYLFQLH